MTKSLLSIIVITLLSSQVAFATCADSTIPGHYNGRYDDVGNGTIIDKMTNLMWMKCDIDVPWDTVNSACQPPTDVLGGGDGRITYTWQDGLIEASKINIEGFANNRDWRLPNIKELASIMELNCLGINEPNGTYAIDTSVFSIDVSTYWSSTPHPKTNKTTDPNETPINRAWNVIFRLNTSSIGANFSDISQTLNVRLVRDYSTP